MPKLKVSFPRRTSKSGFTLVEILVVLAIIGVLASVAILNFGNIQKRARDSQRLADLRQLQTVLEQEINTNTTYPTSTETYEIKDHAWGSLWNEHNYRVPQDPLSSQKYIYVSDGLTYQLYAKFEDVQAFPTFACEGPCGPDGAYNAGIAGGSEAGESTLISWNTEGTGADGGVPGGSGAGDEEPSTVPLPPGRQDFIVNGGNPPNLISGYIDPLDPAIGVTQKVSMRMKDTSPITSVTALIAKDNGVRTFPLNLAAGTDLEGDWEASWVVTDTHASTYTITIRATNSAGQSSQYDITLR